MTNDHVPQLCFSKLFQHFLLERYIYTCCPAPTADGTCSPVEAKSTSPHNFGRTEQATLVHYDGYDNVDHTS